MKLLGWSLVKNKEIDPIIKKSNELDNTNMILEKRLYELHNELRVCKQLLDASQNSVIELSRR